jgi:hypothetical protein
MTGGIIVDIRADYLSYASVEQCSYTKLLRVTTGLHPVTNISSDFKFVTVERAIDSRCHFALISACRSLNAGDGGAV